MKLLPLALLSLLTVAGSAVAADYKIDPNHTMVLASWNHMGYSNPSANFRGATGTIRYDEKNPEKSSVEVMIPIDQIDTFVPKLDEHLKGPDFFDAQKYPTATFKSTKVTMKDGHLKVMGDLTLHGVTKAVTLKAKLNKVGIAEMMKVPAIGFDASTTISRSAFGISQGVPLIGDDIELRITTEAHGDKK
ncbi:MAG: polyisoprenoid-binding protein [Proteobacteria bacterium]|nr:polyisoprenoid-binding protein [Pseudomonadota bacterium]